MITKWEYHFILQELMCGGRSSSFKYIGNKLNNPSFILNQSPKRCICKCYGIPLLWIYLQRLKFVSLLSPKPCSKMIPEQYTLEHSHIMFFCLAVKETIKYIKYNPRGCFLRICWGEAGFLSLTLSQAKQICLKTL